MGQRTGRPPKVVPRGNDIPSASAAAVGLTRKEVHEARRVRDAERADPGLVDRTLDTLVEEGTEPSRAALRRAVDPVAKAARAPKQPDQGRKPRPGAREMERAVLRVWDMCKKITRADLEGLAAWRPSWRRGGHARIEAIKAARDAHAALGLFIEKAESPVPERAPRLAVSSPASSVAVPERQ